MRPMTNTLLRAPTTCKVLPETSTLSTFNQHLIDRGILELRSNTLKPLPYTRCLGFRIYTINRSLGSGKVGPIFHIEGLGVYQGYFIPVFKQIT